MIAHLQQREEQVFLLLSLLIGALTGLAVVAFIVLTERLGMRLYPVGSAAWRRVLVPVAGSLTMGVLLYRFFPNARGSGVETRTQLRLTVDSKFTKSHFSQLFAMLKIRRKNALAEHIIMNFKTKAAQAQLVAFYNGPWLNIPFQSIDAAFVFPLTHEIADELDRVGGEILGGVNRSKTFRVMVAYFAAVHKLKTPVQSKFA